MFTTKIIILVTIQPGYLAGWVLKQTTLTCTSPTYLEQKLTSTTHVSVWMLAQLPMELLPEVTTYHAGIP